MAFKLNIGKEGGGGFSLFSKKQTQAMHDMKSGAAYQGVLEQNLSEVDKKQYQEYYRKVEPMANMNVPGPQYGSPTLQTSANTTEEKVDEFGTVIPKDFVDDSGGGVTGTVETKDRETDINEPDIIGRRQKDGSYYEGVPRKGDKITQSNIYRDGEKAQLEITDNKRYKSGREKPGKMGDSTVKIKKGDIKFS